MKIQSSSLPIHLSDEDFYLLDEKSEQLRQQLLEWARKPHSKKRDLQLRAIASQLIPKLAQLMACMYNEEVAVRVDHLYTEPVFTFNRKPYVSEDSLCTKIERVAIPLFVIFGPAVAIAITLY
jgi:hypothetical protein